MRIAVPMTVLATALACSFATAPAHARARVFVASYGNDANPCTFGSPCKTFQQAVNVVDEGGEVTAIDSAGFGPIAIGKSVTITSPPGVEAGVVPTSGNSAITIEAGGNGALGQPASVIQLRGLTLDGTSGGTNGIVLSSGHTRVEIIDCLIHKFSNDGILLQPNNGFIQFGPDTAIISNTIVTDNGTGIELNPGDPFGLRGTIDHVSTSGNSSSGIIVDGASTTNFVDFTVSNSVSESNSGDGITVAGASNVKVELRDSTLSNNGFNGITVSKAIASLYANSIVLNNNSGFAIANSGTINSFGNNAIESNHSSNTGTLTPATTQ
jgi:hypothetical protein